MDLKLALQMSPNMELTTALYDAYVAAPYYIQRAVGSHLPRTVKCEGFVQLLCHDCRSSPLLSSLVEENERCSKKIAELVSGMHFDIWIICTL